MTLLDLLIASPALTIVLNANGNSNVVNFCSSNLTH